MKKKLGQFYTTYKDKILDGLKNKTKNEMKNKKIDLRYGNYR